jgi:hypothetical protein
MRSDNFPDDFSGSLPGEKMGECDVCGKVVPEYKLRNFPLLDNRLLCDQCVAAFPTWIGEL